MNDGSELLLENNSPTAHNSGCLVLIIWFRDDARSSVHSSVDINSKNIM